MFVQPEEIIDEFANRLRDGETPKDNWQYGLKLEHFVLDKETKKPAVYGGDTGLGQMLSNLRYKAVDEKYDGDLLIGLVFENFALTLMAGGQLEIAVQPSIQLFEVRQRYMDAVRLVSRELEAMDAELITAGYLPAGSAADTSVLPAERYQALAAAYEKDGAPEDGKRLMCGTASLKIVIDYDDELDFVQKFRLAYLTAPFAHLMTSGSPVFEGEENTDIFLHRTLGAAADPQRTGMVPDVFKREFGYRKYAEYLGSLPAYYEDEDEPIFSGVSYPYVFADGENIVISYMDSMDITEALGVLAFYKGLTCNKTTVGDLLGMMPDDEELIGQACERIQEKGYYAIVYSRALRTWIDMLFEKAHGNLAFEELPLLLALEKPARARKSVCADMKLPDAGEVSAYYGGGKMIEFMQKGNEMRMAPKEKKEEKKEE